MFSQIRVGTLLIFLDGGGVYRMSCFSFYIAPGCGVADVLFLTARLERHWLRK